MKLVAQVMVFEKTFTGNCSLILHHLDLKKCFEEFYALKQNLRDTALLTLLNPMREDTSIAWKPKMHHPFGGQVFICEQTIRFILKISKDAINRIKKKYIDQPLFLFWPVNESLGGNNKKIDH